MIKSLSVDRPIKWLNNLGSSNIYICLLIAHPPALNIKCRGSPCTKEIIPQPVNVNTLGVNG